MRGNNHVRFFEGVVTANVTAPLDNGGAVGKMPLFQIAANVKAGNIGQTDIQRDQVKFLFGRQFDSGFASVNHGRFPNSIR